MSIDRISRRGLFALVSTAAPALWVARRGMAQQQGGIEVTPLTDRLSLLSGAGGNIAILRGPDGILLVDTGVPQASQEIEKRARAAGVPITVILTQYHYDHVGANDRLAKAGARIFAHENTYKRLNAEQQKAFFGGQAPPAGAAAPKTVFTDAGSLTIAGETVLYKHMPPAHTDGDVVVLFESANVYHTGDLLFNGMYPYIDYAAGGSIEGMAADAERMYQDVDSRTKIIPGHGPIASREDLRTYKAMLEGVNERISKLVREGRTLEETKAAGPTKEFDEKWGRGFFEPKQFVELIYKGKTGGA